MEVLYGTLFGIAYALVPGPANITTLQRTASNGASSGMLFQFGFVTGGLSYTMLAAAGAGQLMSHSPIRIALELAGAVVLLFLGASVVRDERRFIVRAALHLARPRSRGGDDATLAASQKVVPVPAIRAAASASRRSFLAGTALAIGNPLLIPLWLALYGIMMQTPHHSPILFIAGYYLSQVGWAVLFPALLAWR